MRVTYVKFLKSHIDLDDIVLITDITYDRPCTNLVYNYELSFQIFLKGLVEPVRVIHDLVAYKDYKYGQNRDGILIRQFVDGQEAWTYVEHSNSPKTLDRSFVPVLDLQHDLDELVKLWKGEPDPIPMLLFCPQCSYQHVDEPNAKTGWTNPPHRSHECQNCKHVWRPADVFTTGVDAIKTKGKLDGSAIPNLEE